MKKIALITGASRGIGAATARLLAKNGYALGINYVKGKAAAEALLAEVKAEGIDATVIQADVSKEADILNMFTEVDEKLGPLTALVNNAAILERQMRFENMDIGRWQRVFSVNVFGSFLCSREAIKRMSTDNGGSGGAIVNISSAASRFGSPDEYIDYASSKGAIDTMTVGLAKEVAQQGIRVNAVRPGTIYTDMHATGGEPNRVERVKLTTPMQRGGYPEEIASAVLWLLSDQASFTTGAIVDVTGGK